MSAASLDGSPRSLLKASRLPPGVSSLLSGNEIRRLKRSNAGLLTIKGVQMVLGIGRPAFLNLESMGLVRTVPESEDIANSAMSVAVRGGLKVQRLMIDAEAERYDPRRFLSASLISAACEFKENAASLRSVVGKIFVA